MDIKEALKELTILTQLKNIEWLGKEREALQFFIELGDKIEKLKEELKSWNCDNPICGKGAICNFCALRQQVSYLQKARE